MIYYHSKLTTHICSHSHVTLCTLQLLFEHILYKAVKKFEEDLLLCVCVRRIFATTKFFFALTQSQGNSDRDAHVAAYSLGRSSIKNNWLLDRCKKIVRNALWQEIGHLFKNRLQFQMKIEQTTKHSALHNSPVRHRARAGMEASRR